MLRDKEVDEAGYWFGFPLEELPPGVLMHICSLVPGPSGRWRGVWAASRKLRDGLGIKGRLYLSLRSGVELMMQALTRYPAADLFSLHLMGRDQYDFKKDDHRKDDHARSLRMLLHHAANHAAARRRLQGVQELRLVVSVHVCLGSMMCSRGGMLEAGAFVACADCMRMQRVGQSGQGRQGRDMLCADASLICRM